MSVEDRRERDIKVVAACIQHLEVMQVTSCTCIWYTKNFSIRSGSGDPARIDGVRRRVQGRRQSHSDCDLCTLARGKSESR
jgi:hypothetical protein